MASNDPGFSELDDPLSADVRDALSRVRIPSHFEDALDNLIECSIKVVAHLIEVGNVPNREMCRVYKALCANPTIIYGNFQPLRKAYHSMFSSALTVADLTVLDIQPSNAEETDIKKAFLAVVDLMRRQETYRVEGIAPLADLVKYLENGIFELYLLIKAAFEKVAGKEVVIAEEAVQDIVGFVIDEDAKDGYFDRSITALHVLIAFIAIQMERAVPRTRDAALQADMNEITDDPNPFCFDLYLYIGYRYHLISEEVYQRFRSQTVSSHFSEEIGKAVILLGHAYRPKIAENLIGVMPYFKAKLVHCNSLYFIKRFVRDSITVYPSSFYRYMGLLCLISEITLALYHENANADPMKNYVEEACRYYKESGMILYETMMNAQDRFQGVKKHAKHLSRAWRTVSLAAVEDVVIKSSFTRELISRYAGSEVYTLALISSREGGEGTGGDELEGLLHEEGDVSIPDEYQRVSDYLDPPETADPEGASSAEGRDGPEDVGDPEGPKDQSPTKRRLPEDIGGESNPEGPEDQSPTKRRKGPADDGGKSDPEGLEDESPSKRRKGPADDGGKSDPEGLEDESPTKGRKRPHSEAVESSPGAKSGTVDVSTQFVWKLSPLQRPTSGGLATAQVNMPIMAPTGQRDDPSTQSSLQPSEDSSTKSAESLSNTETASEEIPPVQGASQPKPKTKKSKKKSKGKR